MLSPDQKSRLLVAVAAAKRAEAVTGCPKELSIGQWANESLWGAKSPGNNCFGIKSYDKCFGIQLIDTWEVIHGQKVRQRLAFATFPTIEACFEKHASLIASGIPYRAAWNQFASDKDVNGLIDRISRVYATDPAYSDKLRRILAMADVKSALSA